MNALTYYLHDNGETTGPFAISQLKAMFESGGITAAAQVCEPGQESWHEIDAVINPESLLPEYAPRPKRKRYEDTLSKKKRSVYFLLGLFFGTLGVHNFYAGRTKIGAYELIISVVGWCLALLLDSVGAGMVWPVVIALIAVSVYVLIEICTVRVDGEDRPLK